jgi:hypothetical protein
VSIERAGQPSIHAVALAGISALLLLVAAMLPVDAPLLALFACPLRAATGLPCLGCGCTHAFQFAVRGQLVAAVSSSPLGTALALASAGHAGWTALRLAGFPYAPKIGAGVRTRWACALALAANWIFVAVRNHP